MGDIVILQGLGVEPLIAIVDDDLRAAFALSTLAEGWGYRVACFDGGASFLDQYRPEPGCVLLDMLMPEVDGAEVLRRMRALGWAVPVIAYCLDPRSEPVARQLGAVAFLLKPIDHKRLIDLIVRYAAPPDADEPFILPAG